jgi:hypothetical protein
MKDRGPHFLRVVQALAFVSGLGPVGIVASVTACSSSGDLGADASADAYTGIPSGVAPVFPDAADAPIYDGQALGLFPYDGQVLGAQDTGLTEDDAGPLDANTDGTLADAAIDSSGPVPIGGPLYPPELPA